MKSTHSLHFNLNTINTIYFLKVTKFLGKIFQFEFLVMTEKNIFAYKLFVSINISDFTLYFMWQMQPPPHPHPPEKSHPPLSQQPPSKSWGPVLLKGYIFKKF